MSRKFLVIAALFLVSCAATQEGVVIVYDAGPDAPNPPADAAVPPPDAPVDAPVVFDARLPDAAPTADACAGNIERCNGMDDNCNQQTDEGFNKGTVCTVGKGICQKTGLTVCTADGLGTECNVKPGTPGSAELCGNDLDDDCDGMTDETFETEGMPCTVGKGVCQRTGVQQCSTDKLSLICSAVPGAPGAAELCGNQMDDDCDGMTDEGFEKLNTMCSVGMGICLRTSTWSCSGDKTMLVCNVLPGMPMPNELCGNKLDDDCDGMIDEGFPDFDKPCDGADADLCPEGKFVCTADLLGTDCNDKTGNSLEICDGADNDCNPLTADGSQDPENAALCDSTMDTDQCLEGNKSCVNGFLVCSDPGNDDTTNDPDNCGACAHACTNPHGARICTTGACNPSCDQGYQSCDADLDDGCETSRFSATQCPDQDWGSINGDSDGGVVTKLGFEESWSYILVNENSNLPDDLNVRVTLTNPNGVRFGMKARCFTCGSDNYKTTEPGEQSSGSFYFGAAENSGSNDSFYIVINVYFISNSSRTCDTQNDRWQVKIEQTEDVSERSCNN